MEEALKAATHPHDFKLLVAAEGQRSTSVEQIYSSDRSEDTAARPRRRRLARRTGRRAQRYASGRASRARRLRRRPPYFSL